MPAHQARLFTIEDDAFTWSRKQESIAREAELDGLYIVRTDVPGSDLSATQVVATYKDLATVERAFRTLKGIDLKIRPIHHRLENRVRAHVLLCMLAYYVEFHMRSAWAPMLFQDDDRSAAAAQRASIVAPAVRSPKARDKARTKLTSEGDPVHSFHTLLKDLATIAINTVQPREEALPSFDLITRPTPLQQRAFALLNLTPP